MKQNLILGCEGTSYLFYVMYMHIFYYVKNFECIRQEYFNYIFKDYFAKLQKKWKLLNILKNIL